MRSEGWRHPSERAILRSLNFIWRNNHALSEGAATNFIAAQRIWRPALPLPAFNYPPLKVIPLLYYVPSFILFF